MAGSSLLALIDDIATTLDDVALMTKVAAKKTSGVLGDDLALNAQQVSGVHADREIPVVLAVAKGSFINKVILIPVALLLSAFLPAAITPLLMLGGAFLCFEGFEKVMEKLFHSKDSANEPTTEPVSDISPADLEAEKIKGAVRTDFILSAEIVIISLGAMQSSPMKTQILSLSALGILMTIGVYGLVAAIVKLDDLGYHLIQPHKSSWQITLGEGILRFAPVLMKSLGVIGTVAMFLVGGGIFSHSIVPVHHFIETANPLVAIGADLLLGFIVGGICLALITLAQKIKSAR